MDFSKRDGQPSGGMPSGVSHAHHSGGRRKGFVWLRYASAVLWFSLTVLLVALLAYIVVGGPKSESKYVEGNKLQAIFLSGGQVYFGNIADLNDKYIRVNNIYYLRVNQQVQPKSQGTQAANDISLVKLGCELHGPEDTMLINRDQVMFWENLKSDGQVAKAVASFVKQNPNGQQCTTTTK